jgi:hypothetical protein
MVSVSIKSNSLPKIKNVMAMIDGTMHGAVRRSTVNEMSGLIGDIARVSLYNFVDASARINPKRLHHVYEWNKIGNRNHRLYYVTDPIVGRAYRGKTFITMNVNFLNSKTRVPPAGFPYERAHVFKLKAEIMEKGKSLKIFPKRGRFLVFLHPDAIGKRGRKAKNDFVFATKVTVKHPGGKLAKNGFKETLSAFYAVDIQSKIVNNSLVKGLERQLARSIKGVAFNRASGRTFQATHHRNMTSMKTSRELIEYMKSIKYVAKAER